MVELLEEYRIVCHVKESKNIENKPIDTSTVVLALGKALVSDFIRKTKLIVNKALGKSGLAFVIFCIIC